MQVTGLPGLKSERSTSPRHVITNPVYLPGAAKIINGSLARDPGNTGDLDVLRAGMLMGKITASGKYAPSILGVTTNAEPAGSTSIQVSAAVATELSRRVGATGTFKLTGPPTANGTVVTETVTYSAISGTNITCTAITNAFVAGSFIQPTDGSETPRTIIETPADGIQVTDEDRVNSIDVPFPRFAVGGVVDSSQILHWPSDTSLQDWIVARLNELSRGKFIFDHGF